MTAYKRLIFTFFIFLFTFIFTNSVKAMTLNGPITASTVTVSGDVTVSSLTVSSVTITNQIKINGKTNGIKGLVLQTIFSSTTVNFDAINPGSFMAIPDMNAVITLSNANNYVKVSLSGLMIENIDCAQDATFSIKRDTTDLAGDDALSMITADNQRAMPMGITLIDLPGDINPHTYQPILKTECVGVGTVNGTSFTASPVAWMILEEIVR